MERSTDSTTKKKGLDLQPRKTHRDEVGFESHRAVRMYFVLYNIRHRCVVSPRDLHWIRDLFWRVRCCNDEGHRGYTHTHPHTSETLANRDSTHIHTLTLSHTYIERGVGGWGTLIRNWFNSMKFVCTFVDGATRASPSSDDFLRETTRPVEKPGKN